MDYPEKWVLIEEFPMYAVSTYGRVINNMTDRIKTPTKNQQGIPTILLTKDLTHYRRALPLLVAEAFVPRPEKETFDTPINMDGDRTNNYIHNLQWRPRWFAVKYHRQFKESIAFGVTSKVQLLQTGEMFDNVRVCAQTFGLLEKEIVLGAFNDRAVFPTWQKFTLVKA